MLVRSLAAVAAVWLMACASGGDAADDGSGGPGLGDAATTDDGASPIDSSAVRGGDSGGGGRADSGGAGIDSSGGDDDGGVQGDDSGGPSPDSGGGGAPDTGSPAPDGGSTSAICDSSNPIYAAEAAAEVFNGTFTLCLSGSGCAANQCCYEELSPGNICVAR